MKVHTEYQCEVCGIRYSTPEAARACEARGDILVSTLQRIVEAMGATLSISVRFPDGVERELRI